jgi:uncharacterized protein (TIGR00369 family)
VTVPVDVPRLNRLLDEAFPQMREIGIEVLDAGPRFSRVLLPGIARNLRPGGVVSGPAMVALSDVAIWLAIIATRGERQLASVTADLHIHFLRRAEAGDLIGEGRLLSLQETLAFGRVSVRRAADAAEVAIATASYALRPDSALP